MSTISLDRVILSTNQGWPCLYFLRMHQMPNTAYEQCIKTHPLWFVLHRRICDIKENLLVFWDCPKNILKSECHKVTKAYSLINWRLDILKFKVMVAFVPLRTLSFACGWLFSWIHMACPLFFLFWISTGVELWPSHMTLLNFNCFFLKYAFFFKKKNKDRI